MDALSFWLIVSAVCFALFVANCAGVCVGVCVGRWVWGKISDRAAAKKAA